MPIKIHLDKLMSEKKVSLNELSHRVGITLSNLSIIKNEKSKAIRLSTLEALCKALDCQPGELMEYIEEGE
ncbi:helix-turn-helix domain-containing protein [Sphingobacterium sp. FBM7-1]|uniref:helix-turn-helix domain-containing protein n=1 Tax=Sphingobacterium sp. FBM7-1 TaxID=2886688 RepID=UPI001D117716|nr:helix-turn-helix transcriptional regulator [Sphingobacterium sp. FBM7-1]MCC2598493.1 helix-turn-helix transcriptional regulator [Sphingobacterium sp. FBM7-1]